MLNRRALLAAGPVLAALPAAAQAPVRRPPAGRATRREPAVPTGSPATTPFGPYETAAKYALVMDHTTGAILLDKEGEVPMPPSSMAKLMTAYIVYGRLRAGRLSLAQELLVSENAWRMQGSKMFVPLGGMVKVEDLIRGVIVQSGNDACIVLAEGIAGSESGFVELMNAKAQELGLTQSSFRNSTGWPDPAQRMSCRDIAELSRRIINDFPEYYHFEKEKSFKYNGISQENRNPLVQRGIADGLKTGHTEEAGYGLVASAERAGRRVLVVVNGLTSMAQRAEESQRLLEWSFSEFENVRLFTAGETVETARVWLGAKPTVPLVGGEDVVITMPRAWRRTASVQVEHQEPVAAPIERGAVLGRVRISGEGVPNREVPLLAGEDVPKLGLPGRALAMLSHYTGGR